MNLSFIIVSETDARAGMHRMKIDKFFGHQKRANKLFFLIAFDAVNKLFYVHTLRYLNTC